MGRAVDFLVSQAEQHLGWGRPWLQPRPRYTARSQPAALSWVGTCVPAWLVKILFTLTPAGLLSAPWGEVTLHSQSLAHTALTVDQAPTLREARHLFPLQRDHVACKVTQLVSERSGP